MKKLVYGVGINDANYFVNPVVNGKRVLCPYYGTWNEMMARAYSPRIKAKRPTYEGVTVCQEWHTFSTFKAWMEGQLWGGFQLDKDLMVLGNKIYAPTRCSFIPSRINSILGSCQSKRGIHPMGVSYQEKSKGMTRELSKPYKAEAQDFGKKRRYLGMFVNPYDAHKAWQLAKVECIKDNLFWWKTDETVKESFNPAIEDSLLSVVKRIESDMSQGTITHSFF